MYQFITGHFVYIYNKSTPGLVYKWCANVVVSTRRNLYKQLAPSIWLHNLVIKSSHENKNPNRRYASSQQIIRFRACSRPRTFPVEKSESRHHLNIRGGWSNCAAGTRDGGIRAANYDDDNDDDAYFRTLTEISARVHVSG